MVFFHATSNVHLNGRTIVIPIVSMANIGQLSVDLLISSFSLKQIGSFDPQYFIPVVGASEDREAGITTSCGLYGHPDIDFVVVQQRSPVLKAMKDAFVKEILEFLKSSGCKAILLLSGVDLSNRTDSQMLTPTHQIRPVDAELFPGTPLQNLLTLGIPLYTTSPTYPNPYTQQEGSERPSSSPPTIPFIPGGGLTRRILSRISLEKWDIPIACILQFVLEGDNRVDAGLLASVVTKVLGKEVTQWRQPESWGRGLFGTPHNQSLYG